MTAPIKLTGLMCLSAALGFAESWSGALVDSKCFEARERNVNSKDTLTAVDRDGRAEVHYCSANAKTKSFMVVPRVGPGVKLDAEGNAKAARLVQQAPKNSFLIVDVTGAISGETAQVESITVAR